MPVGLLGLVSHIPHPLPGTSKLSWGGFPHGDGRNTRGQVEDVRALKAQAWDWHFCLTVLYNERDKDCWVTTLRGEENVTFLF